MSVDDQQVRFGAIPLEEGELLSAGALDGEKSDQQRVSEATGNEGASYERSYHQVAVVLWPRECYGEALLQAGVRAAVPYLRMEIEKWRANPNPSNSSKHSK